MLDQGISLSNLATSRSEIPYLLNSLGPLHLKKSLPVFGTAYGPRKFPKKSRYFCGKCVVIACLSWKTLIKEGFEFLHFAPSVFLNLNLMNTLCYCVSGLEEFGLGHNYKVSPEEIMLGVSRGGCQGNLICFKIWGNIECLLLFHYVAPSGQYGKKEMKPCLEIKSPIPGQPSREPTC